MDDLLLRQLVKSLDKGGSEESIPTLRANRATEFHVFEWLR